MRHVSYPLATSLLLLLSITLLSHGCEAAGVFELLAIDRQKTVLGLFALAWAGGITSWVMSKSVAYWSVRARKWTSDEGETDDRTSRNGGRQGADLEAVAHRTAVLFGIKTPELVVYPHAEVAAFAVGWRRDASMIAVSTGLLEQLTPAEVEGVLTHEIAKIAARDVSTLLLSHGMINVFTLFPARMLAFIFGTSLRTFEDETPSDEIEIGIMGTLELLVAGLATLLVRYQARSAEVRADRAAAAVVDRAVLVSVLERLAAQPSRRNHREAFVWPVRFGASVHRRLAAVAHHVRPSQRIARLAPS